jgi:hypothetical protein
MINDTGAVCEVVPLVPVIVRGYFPFATELVVLTVSVDAPDPVTMGGLKLSVAPVGCPLTLSATTPLKPPMDPTVTV